MMTGNISRKMIKAILRALLILAVSALFLSTGHKNVAASSDGDVDFRRPLSKCWQYENAEAEPEILASDNESVVLWSPADKVLRVFNTVEGASVWEVTLPIKPTFVRVLGDGRVILAVDPSQQSGLIQSYLGNTGLLEWQRRLPASLKRAYFQIRTIQDDKRKKGATEEMLFVADDGVLRRLDFETGVLTELANRLEAANHRFITMGESLLFPNQGRFELLSFDSDERPAFGRYDGDVLALAGVSESRFVFGGSTGKVSLFKIKSASPVWEVRTGGAVSEVFRSGDSVIAASKDNFLYSFDAFFGTLRWKRRFEGRLLPLSISSHYAAVTALESPSVEIIDLRNGKKLNGLSTGAEGAFNQVFLDGRFLVLRRGGAVQVFSPGCSPK